MNLARLIVLLVAASLPIGAVLAASQTMSPNAAGDCTSLGGGGTNWTNPGNAFSSNDTYATASVDGSTTDPLQCLNYGFSIPSTAVVAGIEVSVERRSSSTNDGGSRDASLFLVKGGAQVGNNLATATTYTTADVVEVHGAPNQLWGTTWTPAEVNAANFGAVFTATKPGGGGAAHTISLDHIFVTVYYSDPPPAPSLVSPADGATVGTPIPAFDWTDVVDPDGDTVTYDVQADNSGCTFPSLEVDQTSLATSDFTLVSPLANGTYCWRARAVDVNGAAGPWSATRNVIINAPAPVSQTMSPNAAGDCTTLGGGGTNWTNPGNAFSSNDTYATASVDGSTTDPLRCLDYRFTIPLNAVVVGIEVSIERRSSSTNNGGSRDASLFLVKGGAQVGNNLATATTYTTADVVEVHGAPNQLWGTTWAPAEVNAANFGAVFTATKPGGGGAAHTISVDHIFVRVYYVIPTPMPGSFNAFETGTAPLAINGVIRTRIAGAAFALDVVAIESGAQLGTFSDTVLVDLLGNNTLGVALDASNCPTSSTTLQTVSPDPTIAGGRSTVNLAAVPESWRDVRVRVRWPASSPSVTSCSTDNFAIRPNTLASFAVTDTDWQTAGTGRALTEVTFGTVTHKAGRPLSVRATAVNAAGTPATTTNYVGAPTATLSTCAGAACTATFGALTLTTTFVAGQLTSDVASYDNVGSFRLELVDASFASVDAGDSSALEREIRSAAIDVGRFVPDHFLIAAGTSITPRSDLAACSGSSFTYMGERMDLVFTLRARNFAGVDTTNYAGALARLALNSSASYSFGAIDASVPTLLNTRLDFSLIPGIAASWSAGAASITAPIAVSRAATPDGPFGSVKIGIAPADADGVALQTLDLDADNSGSNERGQIGSTTALRFGRLRLENAAGNGKLDLPIPIQAQYWSGTAFQTNSADSCTPLAVASFSLGNYNGGIAAANMGASHIAWGGSFTAGVGDLRLTKPSDPWTPGATTLTVDLTAEGKPYLKGNWGVATYTADPSARATFGLYGSQPKNFIFFRENY